MIKSNAGIKPYFDKLYEESNNIERKLDSDFNIASNLRIIIFLIGTAADIFLFCTKRYYAGTAALLLSIVLFIIAVYRHNSIERKLLCRRALTIIYKRYLDRLSDEWRGFENNGLEFIDKEHRYSNDLDIFGNNSLYQMINTSNTAYGKNYLKKILTENVGTIDEVMLRQEAIKELSGMLDLNIDIQSCSYTDNLCTDTSELEAYMEDDSNDKSLLPQVIYYLIPLFTIIFLVLAIVGLLPYFPFIIAVIVQMILHALAFRRNSAEFDTILNYRDSLLTYERMFEKAESAEFSSVLLKDMQDKLCLGNKKASGMIKRLSRIAECINVRKTPLMYFILNYLLMWDFHCMIAVYKWKKDNGKNIIAWFSSIGLLEALFSLSNISVLFPEWSYPVIKDSGKLYIKARNLGHPLIPGYKCVKNDFQIGSGFKIITGSNMSGKTTFLRTVGINSCLAFAGAPVCAEEFECSLFDIYASMRIEDNLSSGISTFYAELIRIKMIIDSSKENKPMLVLADEIFHGTNSVDRIEGTKAVLRNLGKPWIIGLVSTHDFELCDLENEKGMIVSNMHFSEYYENNQIKFDYKLKVGKCKTTNAKQLMKMVGIGIEV